MPLSKHGRREEFFFTHDYGVNVAMADGSVQHLWTTGRSNEDLRRVLQIGAYTKEEIGSHEDFYGEERHLNWPNIAALAVWLLSVGTLLIGAVRSRKPHASAAATCLLRSPCAMPWAWCRLPWSSTARVAASGLDEHAADARQRSASAIGL